MPFDKDVYAPIYRDGRHNAADYIQAQAERCRECFDPVCEDGCPAGVDIPGFIKAVADGEIGKSYEILRDKNLLPEMCAYVCPSEVQCEGCCVENVFSENPVPIREIQRYVARTARQRGLVSLKCGPSTGKRIAVIGAGPAGIACAAKLLQLGHAVEVFDLRDSLGGVAESSIPGRRLSSSDFYNEVNAILKEDCGHSFIFHPGEGLAPDKTLDAYAREFDAVFLGMGLGRTTSLTNTKPKGVEDAIVFLQRSKFEGAEVPERVAVLGGGNTAMDAATQAISNGARDVYLVYRRSYKEMPAWPAERDEALSMGVHFLMLTQPVDYVLDGDRVRGVRVVRTVLGAPDASGRRRPETVPNSESVLEVDMVLEALGQGVAEEVEQLLDGVELTDQRLVGIDQNGQTSRKGVYAGGDLVNGGATVVQAIAEGMRAAEGIHEFLSLGSGNNAEPTSP